MAPGEIIRLKREINLHAQQPETALVKAMKEHRVLGYGDAHIEPSPHLDLLKDGLPALKAAGATHLALEMPVNWKNFLRAISDHGYVEPEEKRLMASQFKSGGAMADVIQSALDVGLKIRPVDRDVMLGDSIITRDQFMAGEVEDILKDPQVKVVLWLGSNHLRSGTRNEGQNTAFQNMKNDGVDISAFYQVLASDNSQAHILTNSAQKTIALATSDVPLLDRIESVGQAKLADWQNVLIYPRGAGVEPILHELKSGSKPVEQVFKQALKENRVLAVGELDQLDVEGNDPLHGQLALLMPRLKIEGLTHVVLAMHADSQKGIDSFLKTDHFEPYMFPLDYRSIQFQDLLRACAASGIKVTATVSSNDTRDGELTASQNKIEGILHEKPQHKVLVLDRTSKIVAFAEPVLSGASQPGDSLTQRLKAKGVSVATFSSYVKTAGLTSGNLVVEGLSEPLAVPTEKAKSLTSLKLDQPAPIKQVDTLLVYPAQSVKDRQLIDRSNQTNKISGH